MFGQAAAMLIALAAFITSDLDPITLLPILSERLAVTGTPDPSLLEGGNSLVRRYVIGVIFDGAPLIFSLRVVGHGFLSR